MQNSKFKKKKDDRAYAYVFVCTTHGEYKTDDNHKLKSVT